MTAPNTGYGYRPGGIPMLAGIGDEAAMLGQAVQSLVAPNFQFQEQLKRALATNPELIGQLSNLEAQNPGMIQGLFGPGAQADALANVRQTPQDKAKNVGAEYQSKVMEGKIRLMETLAKTDPALLDKYTQMGFFKDIAGKDQGDVAEQTAETGRKEATGAAIRQETAIRKPQETQAGLTGDMQAIAQDVRKRYPSVGSVVDALRNGDLGSEELAAMASDETNGPMIKYAMDQMRQEFEAKIRAMDRSVEYAKLARQDDGLAKQAMAVSRAELAAKSPLILRLAERRRGTKKMNENELNTIVGQLNEIEAKAHGYADPFNDKFTIPNTQYAVETAPGWLGTRFGRKPFVRVTINGQTDYNSSDPEIQVIDSEKAKKESASSSAVSKITGSSAAASATGVTAEDAKKRAQALIAGVRAQSDAAK